MKALLILAALLVPSIALADVGPWGVEVSGTTVTANQNTSGQRMAGCVMRRMCEGETTAARVCQRVGVSTAQGGIDEIVADVSGGYNHTFFATPSSNDAFTCTVRGNAHGFDAESGEGQDISTAGALTETTQVVTIEGSLSTLWVYCPLITTQVTIDMLTCPLTK